MQRKLQFFAVFIVVLFLFTIHTEAQVPDYTYADDFTVTDINGTEHNLYAYLDEGKYVLLDLSAAWCSPCWSYHQSHILNDVHNTYGPGGSDEMIVMMIESDANTHLADLQGNTDESMGDWITGTDYPIVDGDQGAILANVMGLSSFPTFMLICPNRMIIKDKRYESAAGHYNKTKTFGCDPAQGANNAGLFIYPGYVGEFCAGTNYASELELINMGTENMTSATIDLLVNGEVVQTSEWTGDVTSLGKANVTLDAYPLTEDSELSFEIITINGVPDEDAANNNFSGVQLTKATDEVGNSVTIQIRTDDYGCESRWELINSNDGSIFAEGGNTAVGSGGQRLYATSGCSGILDAYGSNMTFTETIAIPESGCYEFRIYDDYGDGICCNYGNGYVRITAANGTSLFNTGSFEIEMRKPFIGEAVLSVGELEGTTVNLQPNPTQGLVDVRFSGEAINDVNIQVFSVSGQLMQQQFFGGIQTNIQLDLTDYTNGLYLVKLTNREKSLTSKIVLNK